MLVRGESRVETLPTLKNVLRVSAPPRRVNSSEREDGGRVRLPSARQSELCKTSSLLVVGECIPCPRAGLEPRHRLLGLVLGRLAHHDNVPITDTGWPLHGRGKGGRKDMLPVAAQHPNRVRGRLRLHLL